ncbi:MAG: cob(I)yrinic acid a,c-diamide adenosyltransferase [Alphaproteobacteria bacterium]|nr:cob(I)yrinic acid a,c-diamide adenosyltransferase [Alphaproteobacteria bacterium]MDA8004748.1 cob(I)yrinic acid a,c-diamide adenosyltransferase [Alphaproteobacteria bacterium]MDA8006274.1 cob(I)yrinic acid a,c-diamide adenosyltransferase [Alphaproteobacteria bacterium]MDA8013503.1 cob(I)yrinic acid a,c-diamide adenosyltransferase [Alphaproteobacteria bacterium]
MAVRLTRIYTRGGDAGQTSRADGARVAKHDPLISAVGAVDEANAALGVAATLADNDTARKIRRLQNTLFDLGADLSLPPGDGDSDGDGDKNGDNGGGKKRKSLRILPEQVAALEKEIDRYNDDLGPLESFILPGGTPLAAALHQARTLVRRAEREVSAVMDSAEYRPNPAAFRYLNRLSDLLFVMARHANLDAGGDVLWKPGG